MNLSLLKRLQPTHLLFGCTLKNYHSMQNFLNVVIGVCKFGQEFFIISIFGHFCTNIWKQFQLKLHKMHFFMQPAQINLHPDENFLHHAKIQPPYFAGQIKRAQIRVFSLAPRVRELHQSPAGFLHGLFQLLMYAKGQLISKRPFGVIVSTKITTKIF